MTKEEKLNRIKNRSTKYELAVDGKYLAGYCNHGKHNILQMLRKNLDSWLKIIKEDDVMTFAKNGLSITTGDLTIKFTGRTQRQAIIEGELPWFADYLN